MPPMMPFDLSRFEGAPMVPPLFPYQMPPVGMPGMPIPPPPAPQPLATEAEDYELEMAAMASEMMQHGAYPQQPMIPQFAIQHQPMPPQTPTHMQAEEDDSDDNESVDPYMAAEIASVIHTLTTSQLIHVLAALKLFLNKSPKNAKRFLVNNPQLVYALLHAQYVLGNSDTFMLPLSSLDKHLANLNRKDRDVMARMDAEHGAEEEDHDAELRSQSHTKRTLTPTDTTVGPVDVGLPPEGETQRTELPKRDQGKAGGANRRRDARSRVGNAPAPRRGGKASKENDSRNAGRPDNSYHQPTEAPQEELPPSMPQQEMEPSTVQPYEPHVTPPQPAPLHAPMQMPVMAHVPLPRTIEEVMMEVQPAPPMLVEEVLKNTEILTNIQKATAAEMQSWPPEQRQQVLSIKLALHFRGISINL